MPLHEPLSVGEAAFLLAGQGCGEEEDLCLDPTRVKLTVLGLRRRVPEGGRLCLGDVPHDHPIELRQPPSDETRVVPSYGWVLTQQENPFDLAVVDGQSHRLLRVVVIQARKVAVAELVIGTSSIAVPC